jgi:hypothetical protein
MMSVPGCAEAGGSRCGDHAGTCRAGRRCVGGFVRDCQTQHNADTKLAPLRRGFFCGRAVQRCSGLVGPSRRRLVGTPSLGAPGRQAYPPPRRRPLASGVRWWVILLAATPMGRAKSTGRWPWLEDAA